MYGAFWGMFCLHLLTIYIVLTLLRSCWFWEWFFNIVYCVLIHSIHRQYQSVEQVYKFSKRNAYHQILFNWYMFSLLIVKASVVWAVGEVLLLLAMDFIHIMLNTRHLSMLVYLPELLVSSSRHCHDHYSSSTCFMSIDACRAMWVPG